MKLKFIIAMFMIINLTACSKQTSNDNGSLNPLNESANVTNEQNTTPPSLPDAFDTPETSLPKESKKIVSISMKDGNSFAVTTDGELYAAGSNRHGQLGTGESGEDSNVFIKVMDNIKTAPAIYYGGSFAINTNDELLFWGDHSYFGEAKTPIKIMDNVEKVCSGTDAVLVLAKDGDLYGIGSNYWGELGEGSKELEYKTLSKIASDVADISVHQSDLIYATTGGEVFVTEYEMQDSTYKWVKLADNGKNVSIGYNFAFFIDEQNDLYGYGRNDWGQFGIGYDTEKLHLEAIKLKSGVIKAWADYEYSLVISSEHILYGAGNNYRGKYLETEDKFKPQFEFIEIMGNVADVRADNGTNMLITTNGELYVSGSNNSGHLGTSDNKTVEGFTKVVIY